MVDFNDLSTIPTTYIKRYNADHEHPTYSIDISFIYNPSYTISESYCFTKDFNTLLESTNSIVEYINEFSFENERIINSLVKNISNKGNNFFNLPKDIFILENKGFNIRKNISFKELIRLCDNISELEFVKVKLILRIYQKINEVSVTTE